uniref:Uncharacterized protein n=1 Tax=Esox lucius TaxID=8010 RepID=A0AAY5K6U7_ESOLU
MRQSCGRKCLVDGCAEFQFLLRHSDGRVRIWRKQNENMDPSCLVTTVQAGGGGVMVWGMFSWHTLGPLVPIGNLTCRLFICFYVVLIQAAMSNVSQVTIIIYLSVVGSLLLYMLFLLLVDPLIRKHDPYIQPLHNEDDSEVETRGAVAQGRGNTVLERVDGAQQRWKKQVQEQRKTVFDRHKMLS